MPGRSRAPRAPSSEEQPRRSPACSWRRERISAAGDCAIISPALKTRIGHLLVRADLVTEAQLSRALEVQNFAGGRIGTLLLERAALAEDDLGKTLALQHGCGKVSWSALLDLRPETLAVLPSRFALKHNAIPYERGEGYVRLVLRDPNDLRAIDELVFVTGRKVFVGVAPEVRIYQALEKYYGKLRAPRYAILAERLSRQQKVEAPGASGPPPPPGFFAATAPAPAVNRRSPAPAAPTPPAPVAGQPPTAGAVVQSPPAAWSPFLGRFPEPEHAGEPEGIPWEDTTGSRSHPRAEDSSSPTAPFEVAEAGESLPFEAEWEAPLPGSIPPPPEQGFDQVLAATERDAIAGAVLAALVPRFPAAAIFSSRSDGVTGWAGKGKDIDAAALRAFSVSWTDPSVFLKARLSRNFYLGPLPSLPRHDRLAAALGSRPGECLVQPVFLGERPVAFLYASSPSSGSFSASDLDYVRRLCDAASTALANAIRLKKGEI
jgi:hypothetical protein